MSNLFPSNGRLKQTDIIKIILIYIVAGGIWMLFSDSILHKITPDESLYSIITAAIGFSFVLVTAGLLYFLINNFSNDRLKQTGVIKIMLIYLIVGGIWILFSNSILHLITNDETIFNYINTATGLTFILFTAGLLYYLINKYANEIEQVEENLHESEKRYEELADSLPQMIFEIDKEGILSFTNQASYKMFGYTKDEIKSGFSIYDAIIPDDRKNVRRNLVGIMRGEEQDIVEFTAQRNDGTTFPISIYASPIITNNQNTGLRGIVIDITERKNMEEQLIKAKLKAEESDKLKSDFMARMSHEIRTPLNVILSYNSFLKDGLASHLDKDQLFSFNSIDTEGRRLIRTIDLILNMAELHTGELEVRISDINLCTLLKEIVKEFGPSAKEKNLELTYSNSCEDNPLIKSDRYIVASVFQNLIDNAIKYTNSGKIDINIYKNEMNNYCVIISDTGIGIAPDYIDKLFLPFSQEDNGYSRKFDGIGLGLALVKKYLGLINAEVKVQSEKGKGSLFSVSFN
jgi:PAS domain S-box-containing protein